jgi:hypothetical protein
VINTFEGTRTHHHDRYQECDESKKRDHGITKENDFVGHFHEMFSPFCSTILLGIMWRELLHSQPELFNCVLYQQLRRNNIW